MNIKKCLLLTITTLIACILFANRVGALECYYQIKDEISMIYNAENQKVDLEENFGRGDKTWRNIKLSNQDGRGDYTDKGDRFYIRTNFTMPRVSKGTCPNYIVYDYERTLDEKRFFGFDDQTIATSFFNEVKKFQTHTPVMVPKSNISKATYENNLVKNNKDSDDYYCRYQTYGYNGVSIGYDSNKNKFTIDQVGADIANDSFFGNLFGTYTESLINIRKDTDDSSTNITVKQVFDACPNYIVFRRKNGVLEGDGIFGFDNKADADSFAEASNRVKNMRAWVAGYTNEDGSKRTSTQYHEGIDSNLTAAIEYTIQYGLPMNIDPNYQLSCEEIFGDKNTEGTIANLVNEILKYPRYIIPAIIILLGTIDFFKAIVASNPDNMKKAQITFIKRLVAGLCVFLVPVFVNIIMNLADYVWDYRTCQEVITRK